MVAEKTVPKYRNKNLQSIVQKYVETGLVLTELGGGKHGKGPIRDKWQETEFSEDVTRFTDAMAVGWVISEPYIVIDVDMHAEGTDGLESLTRLSKDFDFDFYNNAGVVVETPNGGGLHLYYKTPAIGNKLSKHLTKGTGKDKVYLYGGVEFLAAPGKQVVIPGSKIKGDKEYAISSVTKGFSKICDIPESLYNRLVKGPISNAAKPEITEPQINIAPIDRKLYIDYLDDQAPTETGAQNDAAYVLACKGRDYGLEVHEVTRLILERNENLFVPVGNIPELKMVVQSAFKHATAELGNQSVVASFGEAQIVEPVQIDPEKASQQFDDMVPWTEQLHLTKDGSASNNRFCVRNCEVYLNNIEEFKGRLAFNEWTKETVWVKPADWHPFTEAECRVNGKELTEDDLLRIKSKFNDIGFDPAKQQIFDACRLVSIDKTFHPVKEYFKALPKWDEVNRLGGFFKNYFNADDNAFHKEAGIVLFSAIVKRIMEPGCKFDYVIVLIGREAQGKSTAIAKMAVHPKWFSDSLGDITKEADSIQQIRSKLIIEDAELTGLMSKKAGAAGVKAFISRQTDRARLAYARLTEDVPRQCVFMGTTNEATFLTSVSGNRRIWPIEVNNVDTDAISEDLDQLYAEALVMYYRKFKGVSNELVLQTDEARQGASIAQDSRIESDEWEERIDSWIDKEEKEHVTLEDIWINCIKRDATFFDMNNQKRVSRALKKLGYIKKKIMVDGKRQNTWVKGE